MEILYLLLHVTFLLNFELNSAVYVNGKARNAHSLKEQYPNLYFSAKDLPKLRAQTSSSHLEIYKLLENVVNQLKSKDDWIPPESETVFNSRWNEKYGNLLATLAVYCALTPGDHETLGIAKLFMKRLTSYNTWLVTGAEKDEVPMAHSLLGYATALDCLHNSFTQHERDLYVNKLLITGTYMFKASKRAWWGRSYIHNHVATNYMALLTAALVIKPYYPETALKWQQKSIHILNATLEFLKLVVDGSFQEGVSYGSYTMRSLTQFMFISERHFARSYRTNNWLRTHFEFLLYTVIPGFQFTVGFADSNLNWAYEPESHLEFLESYVHKDGRARWVSNEIRSRRINSNPLRSLLYTQFLFFNSSSEPNPSSELLLHVYSDWGVLTYGGGMPKSHAFLAFKCGHVHGRAINLLRPSLPHKTQLGFVPGHEQPDQGSFVFIAKDQAVITESRYASKYTYLQNTLMFGPSMKGCIASFLGQLGECSKWFNHRGDDRTWAARADFVGYSRENDVIFMSGEMTQVYDIELGLKNVYRALIMLTPHVLVVVDIVKFHAKSVTTLASAFFHNSYFVFDVNAHNKRNNCAGIGRYKMCWEHLNARTVDVSTTKNYKLPKKHSTNFINITWKRSQPLTSTAYVLHGPEYELRDFELSEISRNGISIALKLNSVNYRIILASRFHDPRLRRNLLGSSAYGKLYVQSTNELSTFHLGVKISDHTDDVSMGDGATMMTSQIAINHADSYPIRLFGFVIVFAIFVLVFLKLLLQFRRRLKALFVLLIFLSLLSFCTAIYLTKSKPLAHYFTVVMHQARTNNVSYALLITGLPSSGAELVRELFTTNPDFLTTDAPSASKTNLDLQEWTRPHNMDPKLKEWWNVALKHPQNLSNINEFISLVNPLNLSSNPGTFIPKSPSAFGAVYLKNPGWLFKMSAFLENDQAQSLYVVRDPRSWIEHMLDPPFKTELFLKDFRIAIQRINCTFANEIRHLREMNVDTLKHHIALAHIWNAFVAYAFRLRSVLPPGTLKIVQFEKLILSPRTSADDVYSFLEMPFPAAVEHRIMQVTKTGLYVFDNYGTIEPSLCQWGKHLTKTQVSEIYRICENSMKHIGYS